jgi:hypothetical protein
MRKLKKQLCEKPENSQFSWAGRYNHPDGIKIFFYNGIVIAGPTSTVLQPTV